MRLMTDSASSGAPSKSDEYGLPAGPSFQDVMFGNFVPLYYKGYESPAMSVQYVLEVSITSYKYLSESKRLVYLSSFNGKNCCRTAVLTWQPAVLFLFNMFTLYDYQHCIFGKYMKIPSCICFIHVFC